MGYKVLVYVLLIIFGSTIVLVLLEFFYHQIDARKRIGNKTLKEIKKIEGMLSILLSYQDIKKKVKLFFLSSVIYFSFLIISVLVAYQIYQEIKFLFASIIIGLLIFKSPFYILKAMVKKQNEKMTQQFIFYLIALKNTTMSQPDIIQALQQTKTEGLLQEYIEEFNTLIKNGRNLSFAFQVLKKRINIKMIEEFFTMAEICYQNGGDINYLIEEYISLLNEKMLRRKKEKEENFSVIIVLFSLIIIHIYVLCMFILKNAIYKDILLNTTLGKIIFCFNLFSYSVIGFMIDKMNQREE